jgi:cell division transport system permease protein
MLYRLTYFIRIAAGSMRHNLVVNLVAVVTIALALLIMSSFMLLNINLQKIVVAASEDLTISAYLHDSLSQAASRELQSNISGLPGVKAVTYVSKEQALADLMLRLGGQGRLLEGLDENPLPASLEIQLRDQANDQAQVEALVAEIKKNQGVEEVQYAWDWADKLAALVGFVRMAGLLVGGLLFVAVLFIIANTIRLTVLARQDELYIMRLMGATETFIRLPFIAEGVIQGLCGSLLALGLLYLLFLLLVSQVSLPLGLSLVQLTFLPGYLNWLLLVAGAAVGFGGSYLSMGRLMET